jgi:nucleotide-binding universal stress UspA family protein
MCSAPSPSALRRSIRVELERPAHESAIAETVAGLAVRTDPLLRGRIYVVADLENTSPTERARYLAGTPLVAESDEAGEIVDALEIHGMRVVGIDCRKAFEDVGPVVVAEDELFVEAGSPPAVVYIAVACRLRIAAARLPGHRSPGVDPDGCHRRCSRTERNSTVVAAEPGDVLMIPGELFAREWFRPHEQREFADVLAEITCEADGKQGGAR